MVLNSVLITVATLLVLIYAYVKKSYSYWKSRDVLQAEPSFPLGNLQGITTKWHPADIMRKLYSEYVGKAPFVGVYFFMSPVVIVLDPELVKNVLVRDFNYFHSRGFYYNEKDDPLSAHMFSLEGTRWKTLRAKLTPTFTSGKMKLMFNTVTSIADKMANHLQSVADSKSKLDIKDIVSRYSTDVIVTCAFGIDCDSIKDPNVAFRVHGRTIFDPPKIDAVRLAFCAAYPKISRFLGARFFPKKCTDFFQEASNSTVAYRKENDVQRKDFLQLCMDIKDASVDGGEKLTLDEIAAQSFLFYLAGFETSSTTAQFCLYEMALNQEVQDKAREEIQEMLDNNDGKITYEAMLQLPYLDKCINETLRKYTAVDNLFRVADRDYQVPGTKHVIEKGTRVVIPVHGIQRDPNIYPNPDVFDPERFNEENTSKRHPFTFLPFGEGPRVCIGMRFGMMQTRVGLSAILSKYRLTACDETPSQIQLHPSALVLAPIKPIQLNIENL